MRARIDVSEIEAQTKIRAKYLRALENEEWGLLPGPTFVKSFLRTYAQALGLDGRALVEEYRLHHEDPNEGFEPIVASPRSTPRARSAPGSLARLHHRGERDRRADRAADRAARDERRRRIREIVPSSSAATQTTGARHTTSTTARAHAPAIVALSLKASGAVYVCLLGDHGRKLVPGTELQAGESTQTYHARHFVLTLGNSSVTMYVDGRPRTVPPSSQAIGYSVTKARGRQPLSQTQLPTCR